MNWIEFIESPQIKDIISQSQMSREQSGVISQKSAGLNIFTLTSDYYFRENYHSDIIKEFLDPNGSHGHGHLFLDLFLMMLNNPNLVRMGKLDKPITPANFRKCKVYRETHKIDILIKSTESDKEGHFHCIIIENKINDAVDMYKQIPHYVEVMEKEGYVVDAVVYIPKNPYKSPSMEGWTTKEKTEIPLVILYAYLNGKSNIVDDWLLPCSSIANDIDSISILRQYASLIKLLAPPKMENKIVNELIDYLKKDNNLRSLIELNRLTDEIASTMATNLIEAILSDNTFTEKPYQWRDQPYSCIIDFYNGIDGYQIYVYPYVSEDKAYAVNIRYRDKKQTPIKWIMTAPSLAKYNIQRKEDETGYVAYFGFSEQDRVVEAIKAIVATSQSEVKIEYQ